MGKFQRELIAYPPPWMSFLYQVDFLKLKEEKGFSRWEKLGMDRFINLKGKFLNFDTLTRKMGASAWLQCIQVVKFDTKGE